MRQEELIHQCLCGNESAINLAFMLAEISQTFDDLVDGDKVIVKQDIYRVLQLSMIELHYNVFWRENFTEILPLLNAGITGWIAANDIEERKDANLMHVSLITKSAFTPILLHMATLCGGSEHARECAPLIYQHVFDESLGDYMDEHGVDHGMLLETEETDSD